MLYEFMKSNLTTVPTVGDLTNMGYTFNKNLYVEIRGSSWEEYQIIVSNIESSRSIYGRHK